MATKTKTNSTREKAAATRTSTASVKPLTVPKVSDRQEHAESMVKDHMLISLGLGLIPIPLVDVATGLGSNVWMVKRLCDAYGVPFINSAARGSILAIMGTVSSVGMAVTIGFSLGKLIPGIGTAAGVTTLPIANAATTYVIGKMFIGHFELGGTLFDFDPRSNKAYVNDLYSRGKDMAVDLTKRGRKTSNETSEAAAQAAAGAP